MMRPNGVEKQVRPKNVRPIITSFSYTNTYFSYTRQTNGITFSVDGTKLYLVGEGDNRIYQYSLSTPFNVTTATLVTSKSVSAQSSITCSVIFSEDGKTMWVGGATSWSNTSGKLWEYTLSTAWDVSTATYNYASNMSFGYPTSFKFSTNGEYLFQAYRLDDPNTIYRYPLTTAWDITTIQSADQSIQLPSKCQVHEVVFNPTGTQMFVLQRNSRSIAIYNLSTARSLSSAILDNTYTIPTPNSADIASMTIDNGGQNMYLGGSNIGGIYQYSTTTA